MTTMAVPIVSRRKGSMADRYLAAIQLQTAPTDHEHAPQQQQHQQHVNVTPPSLDVPSEDHHPHHKPQQQQTQTQTQTRSALNSPSSLQRSRASRSPSREEASPGGASFHSLLRSSHSHSHSNSHSNSHSLYSQSINGNHHKKSDETTTTMASTMDGLSSFATNPPTSRRRSSSGEHQLHAADNHTTWEIMANGSYGNTDTVSTFNTEDQPAYSANSDQDHHHHCWTQLESHREEDNHSRHSSSTGRRQLSAVVLKRGENHIHTNSMKNGASVDTSWIRRQRDTLQEQQQEQEQEHAATEITSNKAPTVSTAIWNRALTSRQRQRQRQTKTNANTNEEEEEDEHDEYQRISLRKPQHQWLPDEKSIDSSTNHSTNVEMVFRAGQKDPLVKVEKRERTSSWKRNNGMSHTPRSPEHSIPRSDARKHATSPLGRATQELKEAFNCTGTAATNTGVGMNHPGRGGVDPNNTNHTIMTSVKERQKQFQTAAKELGRQFSSPPRTNHNNDNDKNKNSKQPSSSSLLLTPPFFPQTSPRSKRSQKLQKSQKDAIAAATASGPEDDIMGSKRNGPATKAKHRGSHPSEMEHATGTPPEGGNIEAPSTPKGRRWRAPPQSHSISFRPSYLNLDLKRHSSPKRNTTDPIDAKSLLTNDSSDGDESSRKESTKAILPILRTCIPSASLEPPVIPAPQRGGLGGARGDRSITSIGVETGMTSAPALPNHKGGLLPCVAQSRGTRTSWNMSARDSNTGKGKSVPTPQTKSGRKAEPEFISMRSRLRRSPKNDDPLPPSGREKKQENPDSGFTDSKLANTKPPVAPVHPLASSGSIGLQKFQTSDNNNNSSSFIVRSHGSPNTNMGRPQKASNIRIETSSDVDAAPLSPDSSSWQPVHLSPSSAMGGYQDMPVPDTTVPFQSWRRPTASTSKEVSVRKDPVSWRQRHNTGKEKDPREILQLPAIELNEEQNHTQPIIKNDTRTPTPHESLTNAILIETESGDTQRTEEDSYLTLDKEEVKNTCSGVLGIARRFEQVEIKEKKEQKSLPAWKKRLPSPSQSSKGKSAQGVATAGRQQKWESSLSPPPQIVRSRQETAASRWTPPKPPILANVVKDQPLSKAKSPSPTNLMRWKQNNDGRFVRAPVIEETKNTTIEQPQTQIVSNSMTKATDVSSTPPIVNEKIKMNVFPNLNGPAKNGEMLHKTATVPANIIESPNVEKEEPPVEGHSKAKPFLGQTVTNQIRLQRESNRKKTGNTTFGSIRARFEASSRPNSTNPSSIQVQAMESAESDFQQKSSKSNEEKIVASQAMPQSSPSPTFKILPPTGSSKEPNTQLVIAEAPAVQVIRDVSSPEVNQVEKTKTPEFDPPAIVRDAPEASLVESQKMFQPIRRSPISDRIKMFETDPMKQNGSVEKDTSPENSDNRTPKIQHSTSPTATSRLAPHRSFLGSKERSFRVVSPTKDTAMYASTIDHGVSRQSPQEGVSAAERGRELGTRRPYSEYTSGHSPVQSPHEVVGRSGFREQRRYLSENIQETLKSEKADSACGGSDYYSEEGISILAEQSTISGLTNPTCIESVSHMKTEASEDEAESSDSSSSDESPGNDDKQTGRGPSEASSSQTSEAAAPLIKSALGQLGSRIQAYQSDGLSVLEETRVLKVRSSESTMLTKPGKRVNSPTAEWTKSIMDVTELSTESRAQSGDWFGVGDFFHSKSKKLDPPMKASSGRKSKSSAFVPVETSRRNMTETEKEPRVFVSDDNVGQSKNTAPNFDWDTNFSSQVEDFSGFDEGDNFFHGFDANESSVLHGKETQLGINGVDANPFETSASPRLHDTKVTRVSTRRPFGRTLPQKKKRSTKKTDTLQVDHADDDDDDDQEEVRNSSKYTEDHNSKRLGPKSHDISSMKTGSNSKASSGIEQSFAPREATKRDARSKHTKLAERYATVADRLRALREARVKRHETFNRNAITSGVVVSHDRVANHTATTANRSEPIRRSPPNHHGTTHAPNSAVMPPRHKNTPSPSGRVKIARARSYHKRQQDEEHRRDCSTEGDRGSVSTESTKSSTKFGGRNFTNCLELD